AAFGGFGQEHPRSGGLSRVAGDPGDDLGRVGDELLLALSGQNAGRGDDLDPDGPRPVRGGRVDGLGRHAMDVRAGGGGGGGPGGGDAFGPEEGGGELRRERPIGALGEQDRKSVV